MAKSPTLPAKTWELVRTSLREELGDDTFGSWLAQAAVRETGAGAPVLVTPTGVARDWIRRNAWRRIAELWAQHDPQGRRIDLKSRMEFESENPVAALHLASTSDPRSEPDPEARLPLNLTELGQGSGLQERFTFDTFVPGQANEFAHAVAKRVASWSDGHFNPVVFHGPYGFGKTHLLNALGWEALKNAPDKKVVYLTAERFLSTFVRALMDRQTAAFKEELRSADLLLIDDVHFVGGKQSTQEELFQTLAALMEDGRRVVFSSDRPPARMTKVDARLRNHLAAGLVCGIEPADRTLRLGILEQKLQTLGRQQGFSASAQADVLQFLADRFTGSVRELEGALNTLVGRAGEGVNRISLDEAKAILEPQLRSLEKRVTVDDIQKVVAEHYGLKQADLISERRDRAIGRPRQVAMWLAKKLTTRSLPDIGRRFGGRDHTTVMHGVRRIEELRATDGALNATLAQLSARIADDGIPRPSSTTGDVAKAIQSIKQIPLEQLPEQSRKTVTFSVSEVGPVGLAPEASINSDTSQIEMYDELRRKAIYLIGNCGDFDNRKSILKISTGRFLEALGENIVNMKIRLLWSRGNTLRRLLDADIRVRRHADPDDIPLPEISGELLNDLVQHYNVFSMGDGVLMEMDTLSLGPRDRADVLFALNAGRQIVDAVHKADGIMDNAARESLQESVSLATAAASDQGANADRALAQSLALQRNGIVAIVRRAVLEVKKAANIMSTGALESAGASLYKNLIFAPFVHAYQSLIVPLLSEIGKGEVVKYLFEMLGRIFRQ